MLVTATEQSPVSAWQQETDRLKSKYKYQKKKKKFHEPMTSIYM